MYSQNCYDMGASAFAALRTENSDTNHSLYCCRLILSSLPSRLQRQAQQRFRRLRSSYRYNCLWPLYALSLQPRFLRSSPQRVQSRLCLFLQNRVFVIVCNVYRERRPIIATATSLTHAVWSRPATGPWYSAPPRWRKMQETGHNPARRKQDIQVQRESNRKWVLAVCSSPQNGKKPRCARKNLRIKTPHPRIVSWNQLLMMTKVFHLSDFAMDVGTDPKMTYERWWSEQVSHNTESITACPNPSHRSTSHTTTQKVAHSTEHVHTDVC